MRPKGKVAYCFPSSLICLLDIQRVFGRWYVSDEAAPGSGEVLDHSEVDERLVSMRKKARIEQERKYCVVSSAHISIGFTVLRPSALLPKGGGIAGW